jgi:uncharacterized protein (DUF1778 family)
MAADKRITIYITAEDKSLVEKVAALNKVSASEYARQMVVDAAAADEYARKPKAR